MDTSRMIPVYTVNDTVSYRKLSFVDEKPIGRGAFGSVYKAFHTEWGCPVAFKKLGVSFLDETNKDDLQ